MAEASARFPHETPQSKEEYFYREQFENNFPGCERVPTMWVGGCRASGAEWRSGSYTRHGLVDVSKLTHELQAECGEGALSAESR